MKSKKACALLGDFNIDLIKYGECQISDRFYDQLSLYGFRPLILQLTRIPATSSTLIDNIFKNNHECFSKGGNLTCSISDHLMQFSRIDILDRIKVPKTVKFARNWCIFKNRYQSRFQPFSWY